MSHVVIQINGEVVYDHENVADWQLPPKPDQIGESIKAQMNPDVKPAPWMKSLMIAMLGAAISNQALKDPRLQPLDVSLETRATGWTISVDVPEPNIWGNEA
jgi:hypothetical protein